MYINAHFAQITLILLLEIAMRTYTLKMIEDCMERQNPILNLAGQGLDFIPLEVFQCTHIQKLHLNRNYLTELPPNLHELPHLTHITATFNRIHQVSVSLPTRLQVLDLKYNNITKFPSNSSELHLPHLTHLDLSKNQITTTAPLLSLPQLESLYVNYNKISHATLHLPHNLKILSLSHNPMGALPNTVTSLIYLKSLYCSHAKLDSIPDDIGSLINLERLNISHNKIDKLPNSLQCLTKLRILYAHHNKLEYFPLDLATLPKLSSLRLNSNSLRFLIHTKTIKNKQINLHIYKNPIEFLPKFLKSNPFSKINRNKFTP